MKRLGILTRGGDMQDALMPAREAAKTVDSLFAAARDKSIALIAPSGRPDPELLRLHQHVGHALAWFEVYRIAIHEIIDCATSLCATGRLEKANALLFQITLGELLDQFFSGISMSQGEIARLSAFGLERNEIEASRSGCIDALIASGNTPAHRAQCAKYLIEGDATSLGDQGFDESIVDMRRAMRAYVDGEIEPHAHRWHLENAYIPLSVIGALGDMGVFGITIPEAFGGMGLGKVAMCAITEELSRGSLGVGSLGTRSEIAGELILQAGTQAQKQRYLPGIASGRILTTAVFTEPDHGSDLAHVKTRAVRDGGVYRLYGAKTWITHAARADLMVIMARSNPAQSDYKGLSLFLAEKPRGDDKQPFPSKGLEGSEIEVLGYRGMKEFEIAFDGFETPVDSVLGAKEGEGFTQLMQTFESARIQTAARAVGVTRAAMEVALSYAKERRQFGRAIIEFPRIEDKIVMMAVEAHVARQMTLFAARRKDSGLRCDLEAGAAKLYAARAAWAGADNALQIHGGNGYALAFPASRIFCDARILNIFEGAAEIQAEVMARRILTPQN